MRTIKITPIGYVKNSRTEPIDDNWYPVESAIELADELPAECLDGIEEFSHLEIIYYFHRSSTDFIASGHPRENKAFPKVGIFAQRKKNRPNHLGTTIVRLLKREERRLYVSSLDAIDGTPVVDIKPVMKEFLPQDTLRQPEWSREIMKNYW